MEMVFKKEYLKLTRGVLKFKTNSFLSSTVVDYRRRAPLEV